MTEGFVNVSIRMTESLVNEFILNTSPKFYYHMFLLFKRYSYTPRKEKEGIRKEQGVIEISEAHVTFSNYNICLAQSFNNFYFILLYTFFPCLKNNIIHLIVL